MKIPDTRVQYTKERIRGALIDVLAEKPIEFITVKELCVVAGINRGTFYLHYSSPAEVLRELEEEELAGVRDIVEKNAGKSRKEQMLADLHLMDGDRKKYAALIGKNGNPIFIKEIRDRFLLENNPAVTGEERTQRQLRNDFFLAGTTGLIRSWLNGASSCSLEQLATTLSQLYECVIQGKQYKNRSENE